MKKPITILSALLAVQLALYAGLATKDEPTATFTPTEALVKADMAKVDRIEIEEKGKKVTLAKKDAQWLLPEHFDFPAAEAKTRDFTKALAEFKRSWPVGNTDISAKQFNVVEDKFERKINLFAGDSKLSTIYLGSSPSFRKVHIRVDGEKETYAVNFNAYEAPTTSKDWLDQKYLSLDRAKVKEIQLGQTALENKGGDFVVKDTPEGKETDKIKVSPLVSKALAIDFDEVLGRKDSVQTTNKVLAFTVVADGGEATEYAFFTDPNPPAPAAAPADPKAGEQPKPDAELLVLTTSKHPFAFKVKKSKVMDLASVERDTLLKAKEAPAAPAEGAAAGDAPKSGDNKGASAQTTDENPEDALAGVGK